MNINFIAPTSPSCGDEVASGSQLALSAAGDTFYSIATELYELTDQFELLRMSLIHAVNMTEQERADCLELPLVLIRAGARKMQEIAVRAQLRLRDADDFESATLAYGDNQ